MTLKQLTVLCVDDEEIILVVFKRIFRNQNFNLLTASSGNEALDLLENNDIHIVISDHNMPMMGGIEFLEKVKETYPHTTRVLLTGDNVEDSLEEYINNDIIHNFFSKPWDNENLIMEINNLVLLYNQ